MPDRIREIRAIYGTTFNSTHLAASAANWHPGTAHKIAFNMCDVSKLLQKGIPSKVLQSTFSGAPAPKPGLSTAELPLSMYLGKGSATTTPPLEATLLSHVFGGLKSPTVKTDLCDAGTTATVITAAGHCLEAGMAVLIGGEGRRVVAKDTNTFTLGMALSTIPAENTPIVIGHTVYIDPTATQNYWDLLLLGWHPEDQKQTVGCIGPVQFKGLKEGELPEMEFTLHVPNWQVVPSAERDELEPTHNPEADGDSPPSKDHGGCFFGDWSAAGAVAVGKVESADWAINPGITFEPRSNKNYPNGIGGYKMTAAFPTAEMKVYTGLDFGLHADFDAGTAKQLMLQFGYTAQNCVAIDLPKLFLNDRPAPDKIGSIEAEKLVMHGDVPAVSATISYLESSPVAVHWF